MKVIIAPGNGCNNIRQSNWYGQLHDKLTANGITSICENFPDPYDAKRGIWIPHIETLGADEETILVGHSSGAQAALRYAEDHALKAVILVAATYSDLGDAGERASGYYPSADGKNLYNFESMKKHVKTWHQFHSDDDPFIPLHEAEQIRDGLKLGDESYHMLPGRSHYFEYFPELLETIKSIA
ncbi:hypothetical protein TL16_g09083 [Triparma laevis f. inornata]|uniref:Uncharacterized protein n=2 Tax=Triparma laevis TaxID=1534972 RepID=A0A9W7E1A3_9STRA|nr:hypothetical protein TrLO_g1503 [Triparma laevis f. longispina]GMH81904.1 hypothetical protein TL16_g09083 [Triparma laevis f. inornata]